VRTWISDALEQLGHTDVAVSECGLFVMPEVPFLAASPDGAIRCGCHGTMVLEVKYHARKTDGAAVPFLDEENKLKGSHPYYDQILLQMAVTKAKFCVFVAVISDETFLNLIEFDEHAWQILHKKLEDFFISFILPEIQSKEIQGKLRKAAEHCICRGSKRLIKTVTCAACERTFHVKCIKPSGTNWICHRCAAPSSSSCQ
jgi:hypothetical protein